MSETGPNPQLLAKLDSFAPREQLVMRIALRENFDSIRSDRSFGDRIRALLEQVDPRPQEMAAIFAEAREVGKALSAGGTAQAVAAPVPQRNS